MATRTFPAPPVGANLVQAISTHNTTQEAVARELDVSLGAVQGWCSGRVVPRWRHLVALATLFGVTPAWFYTDHERAA